MVATGQSDTTITGEVGYLIAGCYQSEHIGRIRKIVAVAILLPQVVRR